MNPTDWCYSTAKEFRAGQTQPSFQLHKISGFLIELGRMYSKDAINTVLMSETQMTAELNSYSFYTSEHILYTKIN